MKHLIYLLIFLPMFGFAQSRIGYSEYEIRNKEYPHKYFTTDYTTDGTNLKYIKWSDDRLTAAYYFNERGICIMCKIFPRTKGMLNYYVQRFNNEYVIISNTEWKSYSDGGIVIYKLHMEEISYFVVYSEEPKN